MYTKNAISAAIVASPQGEYNLRMSQNQWVEVLVDCPRVTGLFTYGLPPQLEVKPGDILSVPFGTQTVGAIAIRNLTKPPQDVPIEKIRNIEDVVSAGFFPDFYWGIIKSSCSILLHAFNPGNSRCFTSWFTAKISTAHPAF